MSDSESDKSDCSRSSRRVHANIRWSSRETVLLAEAWFSVIQSGLEESRRSFWSSVRVCYVPIPPIQNL
jgi:hypothetical protein